MTAEDRRSALHQLREKFDAMLVAEVHRYNGIPCLTPAEQAFREAFAEFMEAALLVNGGGPQEELLLDGTNPIAESAYCHHRHHIEEHSTDFDTCLHWICLNARQRGADGGGRAHPEPKNVSADDEAEFDEGFCEGCGLPTYGEGRRTMADDFLCGPCYDKTVCAATYGHARCGLPIDHPYAHHSAEGARDDVSWAQEAVGGGAVSPPLPIPQQDLPEASARALREHAWELMGEEAVPAPSGDVQAGADLIAAERARQINTERWTAGHDDSYEAAELVSAAICYAEAGSGFDLEISARDGDGPTLWPWESSWWKPSADPIRNLVKAGALIAAEIDRLQRLAALSGGSET